MKIEKKGLQIRLDRQDEEPALVFLRWADRNNGALSRLPEDPTSIPLVTKDGQLEVEIIGERTRNHGHKFRTYRLLRPKQQ